MSQFNYWNVSRLAGFKLQPQIEISQFTQFLQNKILGTESAARFCRQVAAWVPDVFCNFYLVKNYEIAQNSTTTKAREKNKHIFEIFPIFLVYVWANFKMIKFYLTKLATGFKRQPSYLVIERSTLQKSSTKFLDLKAFTFLLHQQKVYKEHRLIFQGERLSHAVGCAFAICLERKQKRDSECTVSVSFDSKNATFTRSQCYKTFFLMFRIVFVPWQVSSKAVFLVVCDPSMNELWVT